MELFDNDRIAIKWTRPLSTQPPHHERFAALQGQKNLARIARESGFLSPELIAQFAAGELNVSIDRLLSMAKSLDVDQLKCLYWAWSNSGVTQRR